MKSSFKYSSSSVVQVLKDSGIICPLSELEYGFTCVGHIQLATSGTLMAVEVESTAVHGPFQMGAHWDGADPSLQVLIRTDVPAS